MVKISCIVPTYNRAERLIGCLDAIRVAIEYVYPITVELIVVDNNSSDDTSERLRKWARTFEFPVHLYFEEKQGVNVARNRALKHAKGELLILVDDDCIIQEDFLKYAYYLSQKDEAPTFRFSKISLECEDDWPITIKNHGSIQRWQIEDDVFFNVGNIIGCSMIFPRYIFESVGFFNEIFSTRYVPGGNDTEYGLRVYLAGFQIEYNPKLQLKHAHGRNTEEQVLNLVKKYQIGNGGNCARFLWAHPNIQRKILGDKYKKIVYKPSERDPRETIIYNLFQRNKHYIILGAIGYFYAKLINNFSKKWLEK